MFAFLWSLVIRLSNAALHFPRKNTWLAHRVQLQHSSFPINCQTVLTVPQPVVSNIRIGTLRNYWATSGRWVAVFAASLKRTAWVTWSSFKRAVYSGIRRQEEEQVEVEARS